MLRPLSRLVLIVVTASLVVGCMPKLKIPSVHRITVQQGNVITQEMIDRLKPGMTRSQVRFVMGEPVFRNTFDNNRWDYIYTIEVGSTYADQKRVSVYFENEVLAYFTGDYAPTEATEDDAETADAATEGEPASEA